MISTGARDRYVTLADPVLVPDGGGGYTETWVPLDPPAMWVHMNPATPQDAERSGSGSVLILYTYIFDMLYHAGISPNTRIAYQDPDKGLRTFQVTSVRNPDEQRRELIVVAQELVA